jgi:protein-tyrosine phosphatase
MDEENKRAVAALCRGSRAEVRPFLSFASDSAEIEVPDPFYGVPQGFERVLDLVEEASEGLLEDIRQRHFSSR